MTLRDIRQEEFANLYTNSNRKNILNLCPRFGKIRTSIKIFEKIKPRTILIAYPDKKIEESWKDDFKELNFDSSIVTFVSHISLKKHTDKNYDIIIIDEIHLLSEAQIEICKEIFKNNNQILGLTGTLSKWTEKTLNKELDLFVIANYTIEKAIEEGVIVDYEIRVIKVPLDNKLPQTFNNKVRSEKKQFDALSYVINKLEEEGKNTMFLRLNRMRVIQNSIAKLNKTKQLLKEFKEERVLVFCGVTKIADRLEIPSFHSKSSEKDLFHQFAIGKGNHMAVVKLGNTGVTYKPLNKVIINYFDSNAENLAQKINRCMAMEYNNPDKKAIIYIISSNESIELKWLQSALSFFSPEKIKYI